MGICWRVKWVNGHAEETYTTVMDEISFLKQFSSNILVDYARRHIQSMRTKVGKALAKYPAIKTVDSQFYLPPEADGSSDSDDEVVENSDPMCGSEGDSEDEFHARQADGTISLESEADVPTTRYLIAMVTAKGVMMWTTSQVADHFGLVDDENLMVGTGQYLAQRITSDDGGNRFAVDKHVVEMLVPLKVWGNPNADEGHVAETKAQDVDPLWPPPPWASRATFGTEHLDAVYNWLHNHTRKSACSKAADFTHNTRRRYEMKDGRLYYKRGHRTAKNLPKRMMRTRMPNVEILRLDMAWRIVEADHKKYHDGHNRAEARLANLYLIVRVRTFMKYARSLCNLCEGFEHTTKDAVQPIITSRPMELIMFDLFYLPFKDDEDQGICMMIIDHFTKYKWGGTMTRKTMHEVADILVAVFRAEGNCERWHCDNGKEFINHVVTHARKVLNIPELSSGRPRHPQCQGLVERANGTCKRKVLMACAAEGMKNGAKKWNWKKHLEEVLMNENDAPLKV